MAQFYFLSVLLNLITGLVLVYGIDLTKKDNNNVVVSNDNSENQDTKSIDDSESNKASIKKSKFTEEKITTFFGRLSCSENKTFRLVLGILCALVGVMKLLSVFRNDIPVIGDLIPAIASLIGGASLLIEYFIISSTQENPVSNEIRRIFIGGRKYIGTFCMIAGLLHFIFPQVILL